MPDYVLPGLRPDQIRIVQPAIDPLTPKNQLMHTDDCRALVAEVGIDPARPLMSQISRFDAWKNPWQVVDTYRLAKRSVPQLQLAMLGVSDAKDDAEGPRIYRQMRRYAGNDPDVHLYTDPLRVGPRHVNAFQSSSAVMLQRSTREGFGLTVTEAMWKARPVVATPVGGIAAQIQHGETGYLVSTTEDCADLVLELLRHPDLAAAIGQAARRRVSANFLLPRLVRDDLSVFHELTHIRSAQSAA